MRHLIPAVLLAGAPLAAQTARTPFEGPARTQLASATVDVPLTKSGPFYFLDVKVNGRPFRFTLETGAGFFGISERAARMLGVRVDSIDVMPGMRAPVTVLDSVTIGGASFYGVPTRLSATWNNADFDGVVSIPLLRQVLATIDLPASRLRLSQGELPPPNRRDIVPIAGRDAARRIDIEIDLGGTKLPAVLDTRGMIGVILPDSAEASLRFADTLRSIGGAYGPSLGAFTLRGAHLLGDLSVGGFRVPRAAVTLRNRPGTVLGLPFMEQFAITIDQRNGRVRLSRAGGAVATIPPETWETLGRIAAESAPPAAGDGPARRGGAPAPVGRPLGFNLTGAPGGNLMVINLLDGSSAAKAGIRNNDRLVELDGTPAASMNREIFQRAASKTTGVKVVVLRDDQRLEFVITPQAGQ